MTAAETYIFEIQKREPNNVFRLQAKHPNQSVCYKCQLPWDECKPSKHVKYSEHSSAFAMCQFCWDNSTIEERVHHYKSLWYEWKRWPYEMKLTLKEMENAVIAESKVTYE